MQGATPNFFVFSEAIEGLRGRDPFNQNSNRFDREKRTTSKGGPVFSKLFRLDRTDPLSFGPKFPESLVEWIAPRKYRPSYELPYEIPAPVPDGKYFDNLTHAQSSIHLEVEHGCRVMNESREIISDTFSNFISMCGTQICSITGEAIRTSRRLRKNS